MTKKESETYEELVRKKLYFEPDLLEKTNSLAEKLMEKVPSGNLTQSKRSDIIRYPRDYFSNPDINPYYFFASGSLNLFLKMIKEVHKNHKIKPNVKGLLRNDVLKKTIPMKKEIELRLYSPFDLEDLCSGTAINLLEGIETEFYALKDFDSRKSNPNLEKVLKQHINNITEYAQFGVKASEIMNSYKIVSKGGAVNAVMKSLLDKEKLLFLLGKEDHFESFNDVLETHALLRNLPYGGDYVAFTESLGHEIDTIMRLAMDINSEFNALSSLVLSKQENKAIYVGGYISFKTDGAETRQDWKKNWTNIINEELADDPYTVLNLLSTQNPFGSMTDQLTTLGISSGLAQEIKEYFEKKILDRQNSSEGDLRSQRSKINKELYSHGKNFTSALKYHMENVTERKAIHTLHSYFWDTPTRKLSEGIGVATYVAGFDGEKIELINESESKKETKEEIISAPKKYPDNDIFVWENHGVSQIFYINPVGEIFIPTIGRVEMRDEFGPEVNKRDPRFKLSNLKIDFHEFLHTMQINSKLARRNIVSAVYEYFLDSAIKYINQGRIDCEVPVSRMKQIYRKKDIYKSTSWREIFLEVSDVFALQMLGEGELAEDMRKHGEYSTLWDKGVCLDDHFDIEVKKLKSKIPLESSITAEYVKEARQAMESSNVPKLEKIEKKIKEHTLELTGVMETMAQAFAIEGMRDFLKYNPDKRFSKASNRQLFETLYQGELMRGILSNKFVDISTTSQTTEERDERLKDAGLKYKKVIGKAEDIDGLRTKLIKLGRDPLNPFGVYENINKLKSFARENKVPVNKLLYPVNAASALIGVRYDSNIPLMMDYIEKYGRKKSFRDFLNAESFQEIKDKL